MNMQKVLIVSLALGCSAMGAFAATIEREVQNPLALLVSRETSVVAYKWQFMGSEMWQGNSLELEARVMETEEDCDCHTVRKIHEEYDSNGKLIKKTVDTEEDCDCHKTTTTD